MELWFVALLGFLLLVLGLVVGMVLGNRLAWKCVEDIDLAGRREWKEAHVLSLAVESLHAGDIDKTLEWLEGNLDIATVHLDERLEKSPQKLQKDNNREILRRILAHRDAHPSRIGERTTDEAQYFASSLEMAVQRLRALVPDSADGGE